MRAFPWEKTILVLVLVLRTLYAFCKIHWIRVIGAGTGTKTSRSVVVVHRNFALLSTLWSHFSRKGGECLRPKFFPRKE